VTQSLRSNTLSKTDLTIFKTHCSVSKHEAWKIYGAFVHLGNVRTIDVTQFALEALVGNLILLSRRQSAGILIFVLFYITKQRGK
jgi:hypothetical protein